MHLLSRSEEPTPNCRCRVLYLGSAVPHVTKDGLQGIQEPLRELYPEQGALGARGIDSWLSVWRNGLLLENVDENYKKVTRFFPIDSLHYCAAVRYVLVPEKLSPGANSQPRFLPLDSPFARSPNPNHPPLFAAILRRRTGIKVLECHTFICKREMAANALVRCCFHAYADFSYARQIENGGMMMPLPGANAGASGSLMNGGGSLYGTLSNGQPTASNSIEKVEDWRRMQPSSTANGSTLTLNSAVQTSTPNANHDDAVNGANLELSNSVDDISVYNGNENHKVWAGSNRDLTDKEALYGECNTMRSLRSSRPRQITNAAPPPPPPPVSVTSKEDKSKKSKDRGRRKKLSEGSRDGVAYCNGGSTLMKASSTSMMNGYAKAPSSISGGTVMRAYPPSKAYPPLNGGGIYSNGTMLRPATSMNGFHPMHGPISHPPSMMMVPTTLPHPPRRVSTGSNNKIKHAPILVPVPRHMMPAGGLIPPNMVAMAPQPIYVQTGRKLSKNQIPIAIPVQAPASAVAKEEPIYMPSARPMSPIASYQPAHFPHEAYLMQQYASTADVKTKKKKNKNKKETQLMNGQRNGPVVAPRMSHPSLNHPHNHHHHANDGDDDDDEDDLGEGDSTYNTGIYKRKGHLNERAFSYSIRQEHRSRSYGSLANLKFAAPPVLPNDVNKEEIKKEREIMQMMQDLELSGDELERSEVPSNIYQPAKNKSNKVRR